jgi:hypothetical protein
VIEPKKIFGAWPGFGGDERGSAMTEFIVILPVFVLIFAGVAHLRSLSATANNVAGIAYADMWDKAIEVQVGAAGTHDSPQVSGSAMHMNAQTYEIRQQELSHKAIVKRETEETARGLSDRGHMGESFQRVEPARRDVAVRHIDSDVTAEIRGVVGTSDYGQRLFDDSAGADVYFPHHGGPLGRLDRMLDGPGLRPVLAAGNRYGSVVGRAKESTTVAGRDFEMARYYTTLVAPQLRTEAHATAVARTAMHGVAAYDNLLGIQEDNVLQSDSVSVDHIDGAYTIPTHRKPRP